MISEAIFTVPFDNVVETLVRRKGVTGKINDVNQTYIPIGAKYGRNGYSLPELVYDQDLVYLDRMQETWSLLQVTNKISQRYSACVQSISKLSP